MSYKQHSPEFKSKVALAAIKGDKSLAELSQEFKLHLYQISRWKQEALQKYGKPEIFNTDQRTQYTANSFTQILEDHNTKSSMDGKGRALDKIFIERLWRTVKYEHILLWRFDSMTELRAGLKICFDRYNKNRLPKKREPLHTEVIIKKETTQTLDNLPKLPLNIEDFALLTSISAFKEEIISQIRSAKQRIYLSALYIANDESGNQIVEELLSARIKNPGLDIRIFIDFHRAQRGLIGQPKQNGNIEGYALLQQKYQSKLPIYGVPAKTTELMGVFHVKGFVFDSTVIYSGASLNNVYLNFKNSYRLDRYFIIRNSALADTLAAFMQSHFLDNPEAVKLLNSGSRVAIRPIRKAVKLFVRKIRQCSYAATGQHHGLTVTPLFGFGRKNNPLNTAIVSLLQQAKESITIYTPYFNLAPAIRRQLDQILRKSQITINIIVGDKIANDFYIQPDKPFHKIGLIPYLYEQNLRDFLKKYTPAIETGKLNVYLWKDGTNTYHQKGLEIDDCYRLLTGHNLNSRGWNLDMENGLLISDHEQKLSALFKDEFAQTMKNCQKISSYTEIDTVNDYPRLIKSYIKRFRLIKLDLLIKKII